jgi:flagellar basal-body rod protein FlgB
MDFGSLPLFDMIKKRLSWLNQRQNVLAKNIANADTPGYRPRDLKSFDFQTLLRGRSEKAASGQPNSGKLGLSRTANGHLVGSASSGSGFSTVVNRRPYETMPTGNGVVLEEQMAKINETGLSHKLTTELYKKHLSMLSTALGRVR